MSVPAKDFGAEPSVSSSGVGKRPVYNSDKGVWRARSIGGAEKPRDRPVDRLAERPIERLVDCSVDCTRPDRSPFSYLPQIPPCSMFAGANDAGLASGASGLDRHHVSPTVTIPQNASTAPSSSAAVGIEGSRQSVGFTAQQMAQLNTMFANFQQQTRQQPSASPVCDERAQVEVRRNNFNPPVKEWNPEEIGFFDPGYEGTEPVVNSGKNVFYRDVYAFGDRLSDMLPVKGVEKLRTVIPQTLCGSALIWYFTELSNEVKEMLRDGTLDQWRQKLIDRFKERTPIALAKLQSAKYTMNDARDFKDPCAFVQDVMRHAKAANFTSVLNQLLMAWYNLDWEFRLHISEPTTETTVADFLAQLDGKADMWYEMAQHQRSQSVRPVSRYTGSGTRVERTTYQRRPYKSYPRQSFDKNVSQSRTSNTAAQVKPEQQYDWNKNKDRSKDY